MANASGRITRKDKQSTKRDKKKRGHTFEHGNVCPISFPKQCYHIIISISLPSLISGDIYLLFSATPARLSHEA